MVSICLTN